MNRYAGRLFDIDVINIPLYNDRWAGQIAFENPGLVERITATAGIMPISQQPPSEAPAPDQA